MIKEWQCEIKRFSKKYKTKINSLVSYRATGADNSDLPENATCKSKSIKMDDIIQTSTIIISMPEFSASAPLLIYTHKNKDLRIASMPGLNKSNGINKKGITHDINLFSCGSWTSMLVQYPSNFKKRRTA